MSRITYVFLLIGFLGSINLANAQIKYCDLHGSVFIETEKSRANFIVYVDESEAFADFLVFEEENRLYADTGGLWFFVENRGIANFSVYFTKEKSEAHFIIFFTDSTTFVGCD